jgi:hypothetical protein
VKTHYAGQNTEEVRRNNKKEGERGGGEERGTGEAKKTRTNRRKRRGRSRRRMIKRICVVSILVLLRGTSHHLFLMTWVTNWQDIPTTYSSVWTQKTVKLMAV